MRAIRTATYRNKKTNEVRNFIWVESTYLGNPPVTTCFGIDEIPGKNLDGAEIDDYMRFNPPMTGEGADLHKYFTDGEFRTGDWETVENRAKPVLPDIPLPDASEFRPPRANRDLLDSARRRLRRETP